MLQINDIQTQLQLNSMHSTNRLTITSNTTSV